MKINKVLNSIGFREADYDEHMEFANKIGEHLPEEDMLLIHMALYSRFVRS